MIIKEPNEWHMLQYCKSRKDVNSTVFPLVETAKILNVGFDELRNAVRQNIALRTVMPPVAHQVGRSELFFLLGDIIHYTEQRKTNRSNG